MLSLGWRRYGDYDPGAAMSWLMGMLQEPRGFMLRTDGAFIIGGIIVAPWHPTRLECHVLVICAEPGAHWQAVKLLRRSVAWAREHGCQTWRTSSDYADIDPLCRRVGAVPTQPRYVLNL